jgi:hypothetical protein
MSLRVWLAANTLLYPQGGGHLWAYLNWALGLRAVGCDVVWLEGVDRDLSVAEVRRHADILRERLAPHGLGDRIALAANHPASLPAEATRGYLDAGAARGADLLVNMSYEHYPELDGCFRRTAVIDIDPGLLQLWIYHHDLELPPHDAYFTIGEHVGAAGSAVPTGGIPWQHTFPAVALDVWPVVPAAADGRFTTVSHWYDAHWVDADDHYHDNDKRAAFLKYLELPRRVAQPLELALCLRADEHLILDADEAEEAKTLTDHGWRVRHAHEVASTPDDYRRYIQHSLGEFSCAKPAYACLQNAWMSDRTVCYLASGKPAVVEHTGPSDNLPDCEGLFRFRSLDEAVGCFETLAAGYPRQCRLARALAEKLFDARKVAAHLIERSMS